MTRTPNALAQIMIRATFATTVREAGGLSAGICGFGNRVHG